MSGSSNNAGGDQSNDGAQDQQNNQDQGAGAGNGGDSGNKRDPLYADLPDDHPLVKAHERVKAENKVLKPKAKQVDDAEEAKKTDAQRIAELQAQVDGQPKAVAEALRGHLVELHGIDTEDAELFLTGDTPEMLLKQVARLLDQQPGAKKRNNQVPREGTPLSRSQSDPTREFLRTLTGDGQ